MKNKNMTKKKVVDKGVSKTAIGVGAGLVAAAAAGAYFLFGTEKGKNTQKAIRGWAVKAKGEVMDKMEDMKDVTEDGYYNIVDSVVGKYKKLKKVQSTEVDSLISDLKKHWKNIKKELGSSEKKK